MTTPPRTTVDFRAGPARPLQRLANRIAGHRWQSATPEALAGLLLPIVRRVVQTGRGPAALARWVAREDPAERTAPALTADLVRLLLDPSEARRDTVRY